MAAKGITLIFDFDLLFFNDDDTTIFFPLPLGASWAALLLFVAEYGREKFVPILSGGLFLELESGHSELLVALDKDIPLLEVIPFLLLTLAPLRLPLLLLCFVDFIFSSLFVLFSILASLLLALATLPLPLLPVLQTDPVCLLFLYTSAREFEGSSGDNGVIRALRRQDNPGFLIFALAAGRVTLIPVPRPEAANNTPVFCFCRKPIRPFSDAEVVLSSFLPIFDHL